jgi:hypothetical protein
MMEPRFSQLRSRLRYSFSTLLVSLLLAGCVPPAGPVEAPVVGEPDIGTVDDTIGFRLQACRSVNGTSCSQGNYFTHKKGERNTPCVVLPGATTTSIDCVAEVPELDLVFFGAKLNYNVPKSMCEYLAVRPYHYWRNEPGTGPSSITVRRNSGGTVVRRIVNERVGITPSQVGAKIGGTEALTLTSLSNTADISIGTPLVFYRGDSRSTTGVVAQRTGNASGAATLFAASVTMTDGSGGTLTLTPETETLKIYVSEAGASPKFRAVGTISGNIGAFTLTAGEFVVTKSVSGTERRLLHLVFTGNASALQLGDNFTVMTNADTTKNPTIESSEEGLNVGSGLLTGITVGALAHEGDVYTVSITASVPNGGAFSVTKTPGDYGSPATFPSGTVGTLYSGGEVSFLVTDGAVDFVPGDRFSFTITADELPNGLSEGTSYTVTAKTTTSVVISPASGGTTLNSYPAVGTFVFGLAPSNGVLNSGASINGVSGAATCDYDFSASGGPNCCSGSYTLYNEIVGQTSRPAGSIVNWGGRTANCLAGPAMETQQKSESGFPQGSLFDVADTGKNAVYSVAASSPIDGKSVRQANYTRITLTGDSDGPIGMQKFGGYRPTRHYEFICYDSAQEQKAKIRVQVREWNDSTKLANYQACTGLGATCDAAHPDNSSSAGPDTTAGDIAGCPVNDSNDWDDMTGFPDEDSGASACTMSLKTWLKQVKSQGFLKGYLK